MEELKETCILIHCVDIVSIDEEQLQQLTFMAVGRQVHTCAQIHQTIGRAISKEDRT